MKIENAIKPQIILLNSLTLSYDEFMNDINRISIAKCNVKVNNRLHYVCKEEYIKLCTSGDYNKYRVHIYENVNTHNRFIELMWIEK